MNSTEVLSTRTFCELSRSNEQFFCYILLALLAHPINECTVISAVFFKFKCLFQNGDKYSHIIFQENLLDGLPNWLDRLFEGSTQRYYINYWPEYTVKWAPTASPVLTDLPPRQRSLRPRFGFVFREKGALAISLCRSRDSRVSVKDNICLFSIENSLLEILNKKWSKESLYFYFSIVLMLSYAIFSVMIKITHYWSCKFS